MSNDNGAVVMAFTIDEVETMLQALYWRSNEVGADNHESRALHGRFAREKEFYENEIGASRPRGSKRRKAGKGKR